MNSSYFSSKTARNAIVLATMLLSACSSQYPEPRQVRATNPTVSYRYRDDQELLRAGQEAATYCGQYQSTPQTQRFIDSDAGRTVVFECVATSTLAPPAQPYSPNVAYNYGTNQELLDASRNAENYCLSHGSQRAVSTVSVDPNGARTITFRCVSP